jgi:hypothetical protein
LPQCAARVGGRWGGHGRKQHQEGVTF